MNRQPTREDIQRYLQRWQQLKAQYGSEAINIPEFNQLSKVISYIQAQAIQRQQQIQSQQPQQIVQPSPQIPQNLQNQQNSQTQQFSTGPGFQQNARHGQVARNAQFQQSSSSPNYSAPMQQKRVAQSIPQQMQQKHPYLQMSNSMAAPVGGAIGGNLNSNMNNMGSVNNSGSNISTPVGGKLGMDAMSSLANTNTELFGVNIHGQPMSQMTPMQPQLQSDFSRSAPNMGNQGSMAQQQGMSGPNMPESPFTASQVQLLKSQHQAVKYLFKSQGSFAPIPQNIIDLASNERLAFAGNSPVQFASMPAQSMRSVAPSIPPNAAASSTMSSSQSPQVQYQQTPSMGTVSRQGQQPASAMNHIADNTTQTPITPQDGTGARKVSVKRTASQYKSSSATPKSNYAPEPNQVQPITRSPSTPIPFNEMCEKEDLSKQLILPISQPAAQVDAFVLPKAPEIAKDGQVPFNAIYSTQSKFRLPSILPYGISFDDIASTREFHISLQIDARISDLEKLISQDSEGADLEEAKSELNKLKLLPYQKEIRGQLLSQLWFSKSLLPNSHPNFLAKFPELSVDNVIATEQLYKQQLYSRVQAQNKRHQETVSMILSFNALKKEKLASRKERLERIAIKINSFHSQTAKEEQKKLEKMAKQRLQALKSNDVEAYLKLLDHTKDTRITYILSQTNQYLDTLAQAVQTQQRESRLNSSEDQKTEIAQENEVDEERKEKVDYYQVAHRVKEDVTTQPSILVGGTLKEYQLKGLQWMVSLYNNHLNGILADEMGLGKTIQTISLLAYLSEVKNVSGPFLVIVPLSTLTNWNLEFDKWAPSLSKITYKGTPVQRKVMQHDIKNGNFQVLLTTFEYIIKDKALLSKVKWIHMVIDEGHRMKNAQSKLSETLTHFYHSDYRLILTGTPLQNNLPELWALLNFVLPKIFNSVKSFDEWFNTPFANTGGQDKIELSEEETLLVIRRLHKVLRPFLLRRLKKDVEKDLPNKVEKVVKCKMSALQSTLYRMMLKYNVLFAGESQNGKKPSTIKNANNQLMQLRKICNHPFVYEEVENLINPSVETNDTIWRTAGKFELLDIILPKFKKTGHRVLIFFQMTQIMDIMEDFLRLRGMKYMRLDGSTKSDDRTTLLKLFNAPNSEYFCFLLSTRAGGLGLNLQSADTVIIFDSDWNPHQDLQAQDRAHRIGQKNEVRILRLITEDSIEEMILERAVAKLEIDGKVIQAGKFDNKSTSEEQEALLRALMEKEEERRQKTSEEDSELDDDELNQIIARNSDELDIFRALDEERALATKEAPYPTRLFSEQELPEFYRKDAQTLHKSDEQLIEEYGRGSRKRKIATYDDNLTEEEWLKHIEGVASDDSSDEIVVKKKGRPRKNAPIKRQASADLDEDVSIKRPKPIGPSVRGKKSRAGRPRLKASSNRSTPTVDLLSPEDREILQERTEKILNTLQDYTDGERRLSEIFLVKPSRKLYPDYYALIRHPLAFDTVRKRIGNKTYMNIREFLEDLHLIFSNARIYNEEGSIIYRDAQVLENLAVEMYKQEFSTDMEEWEKVLDFQDFDETHSLKPLIPNGTAAKEPLVQERVEVKDETQAGA